MGNRTIYVREESQAIPALASFFVPGLGQLIQGRPLSAALWFVVAVVAGITVFLYPLAMIFSALNAAWHRERRSPARSRARSQKRRTVDATESFYANMASESHASLTPPAAPAKRPEAFRTYLAGVRHGNRQRILKKLGPRKTAAAVMREPDNKHDSNAVAVYFGGHHIGYLPAEVASVVAPVMDAGEWTYAVPFMQVKQPDDYADFFRADLSVEPRRPSDSMIGLEHLPSKPATTGL